jgi:hypothetical protein
VSSARDDRRVSPPDRVSFAAGRGRSTWRAISTSA